MRRQGVEDRKSKTPLINPASKARQKLSKIELREQAEAAFLAWRKGHAAKERHRKATRAENLDGSDFGHKYSPIPCELFSSDWHPLQPSPTQPAAAVWGCIARHGLGTKAKPSVSHPGGFAVSEITNNARLREIFALGSPNSLGSLAILLAIFAPHRNRLLTRILDFWLGSLLCRNWKRVSR